VDDDRRLAFGDHPLGARFVFDDQRVVGGLDAVVEAAVFLQQFVQLRFGGGRPGVGLDEVEGGAEVGVEDRDEDEGEGDAADPVPLDPAGTTASCRTGFARCRPSCHSFLFYARKDIPSLHESVRLGAGVAKQIKDAGRAMKGAHI